MRDQVRVLISQKQFMDKVAAFKETMPENRIEEALAKSLIKNDMFQLIEKEKMVQILSEKKKDSEYCVFKYQDLTVCNFEQMLTLGLDESFSLDQEIQNLRNQLEYLDEKCRQVDELLTRYLNGSN